MPLDPSIEASWERAAAMHNLFLEVGLDVTLEKNIRNNLFLMFSELALEHHGAMLTLVKSGVHIGSALALHRTLIETVARGIWVARCAKAQRLVQTLKIRSKQFPDYDTVAAAVDEELKLLGASARFKMPSDAMWLLNSLTHSGKEALLHRIDAEGVVTPSYPPNIVSAFLRSSTSYASLMAIATSQVASGDWQTASKDTIRIGKQFEELYGKP